MDFKILRHPMNSKVDQIGIRGAKYRIYIYFLVMLLQKSSGYLNSDIFGRMARVLGSNARNSNPL
jgi:hypothetical protein